MPDHLASEEQWAAMDFQPWQHKEGEWTPPSNDDMINNLLRPTRLGWALLYKSKAELIESTRAMSKAGEADGEDWVTDFIEQLNDVEARYRQLADMLSGVSARLLVAATVVEREERANS